MKLLLCLLSPLVRNKFYTVRVVLLGFTFSLSTRFASSQGLETASGARATAMGGAAVTNQDEYAWGNNPAGAATVLLPTVSTSFKNRFSIKSMNSIMLQAAVPIRRIVAGISLQKYGDQYYSEQKAGLGMASKIANVSLGTQVHILQIRMDELPTQWAWIGEFGGIAQLGKRVTWGAHIWNFNLATINTRQKIELPVVLRTGISYKPIAKVMANIQLAKNINHKPSIAAGVEYQMVEWLALRTGISTQPFSANFGTGVKHRKLKIDYALSAHEWLGLSHQFSLAIVFSKKEKVNP